MHSAVYSRIQGTTLTFVATCLVGQVGFNFHLPHSNFHRPLKYCMPYGSFKDQVEHGAACESIFYRTSLDARPQNLHAFSKVNLKCIQHILVQWGKQDTVFTCPSAIIFKFYLPGATGQALMSSPGIVGQLSRHACLISV